MTWSRAEQLGSWTKACSPERRYGERALGAHDLTVFSAWLVFRRLFSSSGTSGTCTVVGRLLSSPWQPCQELAQA